MIGLLLVPALVATGAALPLEVKLREGFAVPAPVGQTAAVIDDAKDGRLDRVDFATAALVASGVPDGELSAARAALVQATARARAQAETQTTAKKRGDRLLRALHDTVLTRYQETQSDLRTVLRTGEFNCLSSAVLYLIAADGLLSAPRGMLSKTHAFVRVEVDGAAADVETTTRAGFGVDRKQLVTAEYLRTLGVGDGLTDAERLADLQSPEEVPVTGLLAALYSNRGVMLVRAGDVEGAAIAFDRATRIAQGEQKNRVASWRAALLNNATQGLLNAGRLDDAKTLLVLALDGATGNVRAALLQNLANVLAVDADRALRAGRINEASLLVDEGLATGTTAAAVRGPLLALRAEIDGKRAASGGTARCAEKAAAAERARCFAAAANSYAEAGDVDAALDAARAAAAANSDDGTTAAVLYNALIATITQTQRDDQVSCDRVAALAHDVVVVQKRMTNPPPFPDDVVVAQCHWRRADLALAKDDLAGAAAAFRRALIHTPDNAGLRGNLREIELRQAHALAKAGKCDEARALVRRDVDDDRANADRGTQLLELCANERARALAKASDWESATRALERGLRDAPSSKVLAENLGRMLYNSAVAALNSGRCDDAQALVPALKARADQGALSLIAARCAPKQTASTSTPTSPTTATSTKR